MSSHDRSSEAPGHFRFTIFKNERGPLTKRWGFDPSGACVSRGRHGQLAVGTFRTVTTTFAQLPRIVTSLAESEAACWGVEQTGRGTGLIATARAIEQKTARRGAIARSRDNFAYRNAPAVWMLDYDDLSRRCDLADLPNEDRIRRVREELLSVVPQLATAPTIAIPSASSCIFNERTGEMLRGLNGLRLLLLVRSGLEIPRLGALLHRLYVLAGHGRAIISKAGATRLGSPIDTGVWTPERYDFIGGASLEPGLAQRRGDPLVWNATGEPLDGGQMPPLTPDAEQRFEAERTRLLLAAQPEARAVREAYRAARIAAGSAFRVTWDNLGGVAWLVGEHEIILDDGQPVTADEIFAHPAAYDRRYCADPLEPDYNGDRRLAQIYALGQTSGPAIHSNAHGGAVFMLRPSAEADFAGELNAADSARLAAARGRYAFTDVGNSERFVAAYRDSLMYERGVGWRVWDGRRWRRSDDVAVEGLGLRLVLDMRAAMQGVEDTKAYKFSKDSEAYARIRAMIALARPTLSVDSATLDNDHYLFNCLNGTIDLRTGELRPHSPDDRITKLAPVSFDREAKAPRWDAFLKRIFADDRDLMRFVQQGAGYSMTGDTSEQVLFFLYGSGQNGKSTFFEILRAMFGDYARQIDFSTLLPRRDPTGPRSDIVRLVSSRFVTTTEAPSNTVLDVTRVKSMTGGDTQVGRGLWREEIEFRPTGKLWAFGNSKPRVDGDDPAIWRRIRAVPFDVTIPADERDAGLLEKLHAELPGILAWAVRGCLEWRLLGLSNPPAVQQATAAYRAEMSALGAFVLDRCVFDSRARVTKDDLHAAYAAWCSLNGMPSADPIRVFNKQFGAHDPIRIADGKSNGVAVWRGVALRPPASE